jgi:hypothetical protein
MILGIILFIFIAFAIIGPLLGLTNLIYKGSGPTTTDDILLLSDED